MSAKSLGKTKNGKDITLTDLHRRGFSREQIAILKKCHEDNIDISWFCNKKIDASRMYGYYMCLRAGINLNEYNLAEFNEAHLMQLAEGMKDGVDISEFADPRMSHTQMSYIRQAMLEGTDYSLYKETVLSLQEAIILRAFIRKNDKKNARAYVNRLIHKGNELLTELDCNALYN